MTLIDTNVLIDIVSDDRVWYHWSSVAIAARSQAGQLLINEIVYAELSARFDDESILDETIGRLDVAFFRLPKPALFLAGHTYNAYRSMRGPRTSILADFFLGAHASVLGIPILTRDVRRYRTYFPDVELVAPM